MVLPFCPQVRIQHWGRIREPKGKSIKFVLAEEVRRTVEPAGRHGYELAKGVPERR